MNYRCSICILGDELNLFDTQAMREAAAVLRHRLSAEKRKYLTLCTMLSNEPDELVELTDEALEKLTFGMPLPHFNSPKEDAKWWSERASPSEREAYVIHCFLALSKKRQRELLRYIQGKLIDG
jgi:hypothetical protein